MSSYSGGMPNEQEHAIIVSTLKQVISGGISGHSQPQNQLRYATSSLPSGTKKVEISVLDGDTCHECKIDGCLGCDFFPQSEQDKDKGKTKMKKSKYMGVRQRRRGHGANGQRRFGTRIAPLGFGSGRSRRRRKRPGLMTKQPSSFAETKPSSTSQ